MSGADLRRRRATAPGRAPRRLTGLELGEVSLVDSPANEGALHILSKAEDPADATGEDPAGNEVAELQRQIAAAEAGRAAAGAAGAAANAARVDIEAALAVLADVAAPAPVAPVEPAADVVPPPAKTAQELEEIGLDALAIIARERPEGGSRRFWLDRIDQLGRHLAPDETPTRQRARALDDPRGHDFVAALQSRPA